MFLNLTRIDDAFKISDKSKAHSTIMVNSSAKPNPPEVRKIVAQTENKIQIKINTIYFFMCSWHH